MTITNKNLKRRIIEISHKHKLSHLGSCLTAVDIIQDIYKTKKDDEKFVLSQGHSGLALYTVMEAIYPRVDAEKFVNEMGIHPDRLFDNEFIDCSTGSLGQGLPIALGMALADRTKNVYCLISDGELGEGSLYESLLLAKKFNVSNLKIYVNSNGYGGYGETVGIPSLITIGDFYKHDVQITLFNTNVDYLFFLSGLKGHYHTMSDSEYQLAMGVLS